jgi:hypothetical protein
MHQSFNFSDIIRDAWYQYDGSKTIESIVDISAMVSTNHVFRVRFSNRGFVIAKCSYYGKFKYFKEDHTIIHAMSTMLQPPYDHFLARSLIKNNEVFTYQYKAGMHDAWVVFYHPIAIDHKLPRILERQHIEKLGSELALFHLACKAIVRRLPPSSKTMHTDMQTLVGSLDASVSDIGNRLQADDIRRQTDLFFESCEQLGYAKFPKIPVFVDWNIGNFSVNANGDFFSRWDYDWFRISTRVMDFYFFSRVASSIGDRTVFSYLVDPLLEDRFIWFLKEYHQVYPLTREEVLFLKEIYRFFILNYVIKDGTYFFHKVYSMRLQREAFELYFPQLDRKFNADRILRALDL